MNSGGASSCAHDELGLTFASAPLRKVGGRATFRIRIGWFGAKPLGVIVSSSRPIDMPQPLSSLSDVSLNRYAAAARGKLVSKWQSQNALSQKSWHCP